MILDRYITENKSIDSVVALLDDTALETMNTLGVHQFDGQYIQKMLKESEG